jgi:hypothetical protein
MDTTFWTGIILGAFLGLVCSILGNLWTDAVRNFIDKRKRIRLNGKKSKEVRTYCFVRALREGNPTAKVLFDIDQTMSVRSTLFMIACLSFLVAMLFVARQPQIHEHLAVFLTLFTAVFVMFLFFYGYATSLHLEVLRIKYRLLRFEEYETSVRVKWGDDAV